MAVTMATVTMDAAATAMTMADVKAMTMADVTMAVLAMDAAAKAAMAVTNAAFRVTMAVTAMEVVVIDVAAMETQWRDGLKGRLLLAVARGTCSAPEG